MNSIDVNNISTQKPDYSKLLQCKHCCNCEECDFFKQYFTELGEEFLLAIPKVVDSTFQILMHNKPFLRDFHDALALRIEENLKVLVERYKDCFDEKQRIKRKQKWREWVKKGIAHRDKEKCVIGRENLSSEMSSDAAHKHIDHIVPLDNFGNNNPSNLQLLCDKHNQRKGSRGSFTSDLEVPLWESKD